MEIFESKIRPALIEHCIRCHGAEKQQGGLRLDAAEGWKEGGDTGEAIVAGMPAASLLLTAIEYEDSGLEMPPKGILPKETIEAFREWIRLGAPDPRTVNASEGDGDNRNEKTGPPSVEEGRQFWAFQPLRHPEVPADDSDQWSATPIDRFIRRGHLAAGIQPVPDASREALLRRVSFDLTGLPPSAVEVEQFLQDESPDAYGNLVDRLLNSKAYGERWGRNWLGVVRYAESSGGGRTLLFPDAWRYRDYVIDAFNDDMPYDQFVKEQIAGDLLPAENWQDRRRQLIATAFLLLGPTNYERQDKDVLEMDVVDEQLDTLGKSMLGMTIGCARCHDHKFDPIPMKDYYAMAGILKSTKAMIHSNVSQWNKVTLPVSPEEEAEISVQQKKLDEAIKVLTQIDKQIAEAKVALVAAGGTLEEENAPRKNRSFSPDELTGLVVDNLQAELIGEWMESAHIKYFVGENYVHDQNDAFGEKRIRFRPELKQAGEYEVRIAYNSDSGRTRKAQVEIEHQGGKTLIEVNQRKTPEIDGVLHSLGRYSFDPADGPSVTLWNHAKGGGVLIGDAVVFVPVSQEEQVAEQEAVEVPASEALVMARKKLTELDAALKRQRSAVDALKAHLPRRPVAMAAVDGEDAGDIHLAIRGVVHNQGALTPRGVMQVASDQPCPEIPKGQSGRVELAEWIGDPQNPLTARVMVNRIWGWLFGDGIVSTVDNFGSMGQLPTDPELLDYLASEFISEGWSVKQLVRQMVMSRVYRLGTARSADQLAIDPDNRLHWRMDRKRLRAGDIRDALLAVSGQLDLTYGGKNMKPGTSSEYGYRFESPRRSVYVPVFRNTLPEMFEVFDFPDPNIQTGARNESTIASQALLLMNHPFVIEQSRLAAENLLQSGPSATEQRIDQAFRQVLGRSPSDAEMLLMGEPLVDAIDGEQASDDEKSLDRWTSLYHLLFQSVDFRYLQ
ncbi:DUF1553 domain-containing protein [Roseimaritima multifibrata]|nr:DUF1553 domain-containing protein [Roseimaritima multifibrata]